MRRKMTINIKISLKILGRGFSVCLCFSKMDKVDIARAQNRRAMPSNGVIEGYHFIERKVAKNRITESAEISFLGINFYLFVFLTTMVS